jgi:hypothetical protein
MRQPRIAVEICPNGKSPDQEGERAAARDEKNLSSEGRAEKFWQAFSSRRRTP